MTASKFIVTAAAVSSLVLSASSTVPKTPVSSIVASSRKSLFGIGEDARFGQGWSLDSLRGGSLGKANDHSSIHVSIEECGIDASSFISYILCIFS